MGRRVHVREHRDPGRYRSADRRTLRAAERPPGGVFSPRGGDAVRPGRRIVDGVRRGLARTARHPRRERNQLAGDAASRVDAADRPRRRRPRRSVRHRLRRLRHERQLPRVCLRAGTRCRRRSLRRAQHGVERRRHSTRDARALESDRARARADASSRQAVASAQAGGRPHVCARCLSRVGGQAVRRWPPGDAVCVRLPLARRHRLRRAGAAARDRQPGRTGSARARCTTSRRAASTATRRR